MRRVWIYESELRAIAHETTCWTGETGGDLFGTWDPQPVILLATRLGPDSRREADRCRFDLRYLESLSRTLAVEWGLDYFGDWHSHGFSTLTHPSRVDRERMGRVMTRNQFPEMLEFICTRTEAAPEISAPVSVHGYHFPAATWYDPAAVEIVMLPGMSPLRELFLLQKEDQLNQDWDAGHALPLSSINGFSTAETSDREMDQRHRERISQRASKHRIGRVV